MDFVDFSGIAHRIFHIYPKRQNAYNKIINEYEKQKYNSVILKIRKYTCKFGLLVVN